MAAEFSFDMFNALVRHWQAVREDTYLNAPLYYALTGRKGLWVHQGYGAAMVVCAHPNIPDSLLAFPEIGAARGKLAASVLSHLDAPAGGVQLARYNEADIFNLREAFSQQNDCRVEHLQIQEEKTLDWRFPSHILDTTRVAVMDGGAFMKTRNRVRKVEGSVQIMTLQDSNALRAMRATLKYWEGSMVMRGKEGEDMSGFYTTLFSMIEKRADQFNGLIFKQGNRPVGFTIYDRPFMKTANLLANLSDASVTGLADYQVVATCRALAATGVAFMNFGGSENESLDHFKRKFAPEKSLPLLSAEVVYGRYEDINVRSMALAL